ncbi:MAG: hypothetical protein HDR82_04380 [Bacteroides sp.]|nr:hypothetical protein [Bacteroides sp.]
MRLILIYLVVLTGITFNLSAQEDKTRFTATLYGGLYLNNEQAWQLEPSVTWNFHRYIGVGVGIELTGQYNQPGRQTLIDGHVAELANNERDVAWIIFKPTVVLKSPDVWQSSDRYYRLWFQAEPGVSLGCPFRNSLTYEIKDFQGQLYYTSDYRRFSNKGLQWFYWNARASVNFAIDHVVIGAGYYLSNLDYYSGRRNVTLANGQKFYVPKKSLSQSTYFSIGYQF